MKKLILLLAFGTAIGFGILILNSKTIAQCGASGGQICSICRPYLIF